MKRRFVYFYLLILFSLMPMLSWADTYCPKKGEEFVFYPVAKVYKQILHGYDCFYDPAKAYKNGQTKAIAANRFKPNAHGLTSFSEIEGHTFVVVSMEKENADLSVDQQNFLCFLRRDDGAELLLRIPFVRKTIDNTLTRGMAQVLTEKNSFRKGPAVCIINIPACPVDQLRNLSKQMVGQTLTRNKDRELDMTVSTLTQYLNGADVSSVLFRSDDVFCESVSFMEVKGYLYQQPIASANLKGVKVKLPVFDFRGDGQSVYGSYFSINTVFRTPSATKVNSVLAELVEEPEVEEPEVEEPKQAEKAEAEKTEVKESEVREPEIPRVPIKVGELAKVASESSVTGAEIAKPDVPEMMVANNVKMTKPSKITAEPAKIEGAPVKLDVPEMMVATNVKVAKPSRITAEPAKIEGASVKLDVPEKMELGKVDTQSLVLAENIVEETVEENPTEVALAEEKPAEVKLVEEKPAEVALAEEKPAEETPAEIVQPTAEELAKARLADLTKRFGARNAALIAKGKVSKGFSKEMCKEALGEPDYINTTQNMFTTLEQWVYGINLMLYFQKEKLQYIDEF